MTEDELLKIKSLLVDDAIAAIKQQNDTHQKQIVDLVQPALRKVDSFEERIHILERERGLIIKGAVMYASVVAALVGAGWGWIKSKIHWG